MKKSDILRQARGLIERKTKHTICTALFGVMNMTPAARSEIVGLRQWIEALMGGNYLYEQWLDIYHRDFFRDYAKSTNQKVYYDGLGWNHDVCRPGRLQWLDWMISYWEAEEAKEAMLQIEPLSYTLGA